MSRERGWGALLVDKPAGMTSFQVVHRVRKTFGLKRVGHCGTLDPDATGLLILLVEEGTRFQRFIMADEKSYSGVIRLGLRTATDDLSGSILGECSTVPELDEEMLRTLEQRFSGTLLQRPPNFSAIKVNGERAYKKARSGEEVALCEREVVVHALSLRILDRERLQYHVHCSKGFYVRSLARDIGEFLGCGGVAESIRRETTGKITLAAASSLEALLAQPSLQLLDIQQLLPSNEVSLMIEEGDLKELLLGRKAPLIRLHPPHEGAFLQLPSGEIRGRITGTGEVEFLIP